jgi:hypothetical protein
MKFVKKNILRVIIFIVLFGLFFALFLQPFDCGTTDEIRKRRSECDCEVISITIQKYHLFEEKKIEKLIDLKEKYMLAVDTLKDPWRNSYELDLVGGYVFSKGVDREASRLLNGSINWGEKANRDNIKMSYRKNAVYHYHSNSR